jgi:hypothetical protein
MKYHKYQHIEKIGTDDTEGILNGTVYVTCKIDGANGAAYLDGGAVHCGTRAIETQEDHDDSGFAKFVLHDPHIEKALKEHPDWIIYGEWLTPHTLKRYAADAWRKFYVFDILKVNGPEVIVDENGVVLNGEYIPIDEYVPMLEGYGINFIPLLAKLENPTMDDLKALLQKSGSFLITEGLGEGIVIKNYGYRNKFGHQTWAKMLTEDFSLHKKELRKENSDLKAEHPVEHRIVDLFLTPEAISKEFLKFKETKGGWDITMTGEFLGRFWNEWLDDNIKLILKKLKTPTIDFKALQIIVMGEARDIIIPPK